MLVDGPIPGPERCLERSKGVLPVSDGKKRFCCSFKVVFKYKSLLPSFNRTPPDLRESVVL